MKKLIAIAVTALLAATSFADGRTYDYSNVWFNVTKYDAGLAGWTFPSGPAKSFVTNATLRVPVADSWTPPTNKVRGIERPIIVGRGATVCTNGVMKLYDVNTNDYIGTWIQACNCDVSGGWIELEYAFRDMGIYSPYTLTKRRRGLHRPGRGGYSIIIR